MMNMFRQSCHTVDLAVPPTVDENPLITTAEDRELYDEVFRLYFADPQHFGQTMRICKTTSRPELARIRIWLVEKTPGLDDPEFEYKARHRLIWLRWGLTDFPKCPVCGKPIGYRTNRNFDFQNMAGINDPLRYKVHCDRKCAMNDQTTLDQIAATWQDTLGTTHPMRVPEICAKVRKDSEDACMEQYGVRYWMAVPEIAAKRAQNNEETYGVPFTSQLPEVQAKRLGTLADRYGTICPVAARYRIDGFVFDSSWEACVWVYFRDTKADIVRSPTTITYEFDGKKRRYYPDFLIDGRLVEVKGDNFFEDHDKTKKMISPYRRNKKTPEQLAYDDARYEAKHQCMLSHGVEIWTSEDVAPYIRYADEKYGKGWLDTYKV